MKTKAFLMVCLFMGIGLTQLSAQNGKNGTGAVSTYEAWDNLWQPIYCNGFLIDELYCDLTNHSANIYKDSVIIQATPGTPWI